MRRKANLHFALAVAATMSLLSGGNAMAKGPYSSNRSSYSSSHYSSSSSGSSYHSSPSYSSPSYSRPSYGSGSSAGSSSSGSSSSMGLSRPSLSSQPSAPAAAPPTSSMGMNRPSLPDRTAAPAPAGNTSAMDLTRPSMPNQPVVGAPTTSAMGLTRAPLTIQNGTQPATAPTTAMGMSRPSLPGQPVHPTNTTVPPVAMTTAPVGSSLRPVPSGQLDRAASMAASRNALNSYRQTEARNKLPPQPLATAQVRHDYAYASARRSWGSTDDYWRQRQGTISSWGYSQPRNVYVFEQRMHPNYGIYDNLFLTILLTHAADSAYYDWAYSHRDEPWYGQWHRDAEAQSMQDADMQAHLHDLDARVAQLQSQGATPLPPGQLPPGIPQAAAVSPEAVVADAGSSYGVAHGWLLGLLGLGAVGGGGLFAAKMIRRGRAT